jgi:hypothetical protein
MILKCNLLGYKKSKLLVLMLESIKPVALVGPLFHLFLAFLLLPPYTGYLWCQIVDPFTNEVDCRYRTIHLSSQSIFIRLISGIFAAVAFKPAVLGSISVTMIEIIIGLVSFRESLASLRKCAAAGKTTSTRILKTFREVQITVNDFNELYKHWFFAHALAIADLVLILSGYCAIKLWNNVFLFGVAGFLNVSITALMLSCYILTVASKVWVESENLIRNMKAKPSYGKSRLLRKKLAACSGLKIKIGCVNFVDRATAGVFLLFSVEQIGSLAMIN